MIGRSSSPGRRCSPLWPPLSSCVVCDSASHTATDNVLMAAARAKGTSVIENAAREPEVQDLAAFLTAMGARIQGAGTSRIEVEGVDCLHPADHVCIPDR